MPAMASGHMAVSVQISGCRINPNISNPNYQPLVVPELLVEDNSNA